jgi:hypothetical protein
MSSFLTYHLADKGTLEIDGQRGVCLLNSVPCTQEEAMSFLFAVSRKVLETPKKDTDLFCSIEVQQALDTVSEMIMLDQQEDLPGIS